LASGDDPLGDDSAVVFQDEFEHTDKPVEFLELPRFDMPIATLQSVQLALDSTWALHFGGRAADHEADGIVFTDNDAGISGYLDAAFRLTLFDPSSIPSTSVVELNRSASDSCYQSRSDIISDPNASCAMDSDLGDHFGQFDWDFPVSNLPLSAFIGTDNLNLSVMTTATLHGYCDSDDGGDECVISGDTRWDGSVTVTYNYLLPDDNGGGDSGGGDGGGSVSVPEPTTLDLAGAGFLMLMLSMRRRAR
jgi:hypothetical protein